MFEKLIFFFHRILDNSRLSQRKDALEVKVNDLFKGGIRESVKRLGPVGASIVDENIEVWKKKVKRLQQSVRHLSVLSNYVFFSSSTHVFRTLKVRQRVYELLRASGGRLGWHSIDQVPERIVSGQPTQSLLLSRLILPSLQQILQYMRITFSQASAERLVM